MGPGSYVYVQTNGEDTYRSRDEAVIGNTWIARDTLLDCGVPSVSGCLVALYWDVGICMMNCRCPDIPPSTSSTMSYSSSLLRVLWSRMFCDETDRNHFFGWVCCGLPPTQEPYLRVLTQPEENVAKRGQNATSNVVCFLHRNAPTSWGFP